MTDFDVETKDPSGPLRIDRFVAPWQVQRVRVRSGKFHPAKLDLGDFRSQGCRFEPCRVQSKYQSRFAGDYDMLKIEEEKACYRFGIGFLNFTRLPDSTCADNGARLALEFPEPTVQNPHRVVIVRLNKSAHRDYEIPKRLPGFLMLMKFVKSSFR